MVTDSTAMYFNYIFITLYAVQGVDEIRMENTSAVGKQLYHRMFKV